MAPSATSTVSEPLWFPPNAGNTPMDAYRRHVNGKFSQYLTSTQALQKWTIAYPQSFWMDLYDYLGIIPPLPPNMTHAYDDSLPISSVPRFFEGLQLNYTENVLENRDPNAIALIQLREGSDLAGEEVTWKELREKVRRTRSALLRTGVEMGDRVAALVSNSVWAVVLFLSSASIGAIFTSISPDLGVEGCVARLQQVTPTILFADGDATYKGRRTSTIPKMKHIMQRLTTKPEVVIIPIAEQVNGFMSIDQFLAKSKTADALIYDRVSFSHPLMICYSSGTTGAPKCIVHQHGLILQLKKMSMLHNSLSPADVVMQYSSTTWVLFYIMNGHLSTGATCICYDGSPMWPDAQIMMRILEKHRVTYFGSSPRYLLELEQSGTIPQSDFDLSRLRMVNTTGASLSNDQYRWFYRAFPAHVHLSNTAGGTDTATSLLASDPAGALYAGEMQIMSLGTDLDILDPETGESIMDTGRPGEMVIRKPFPSMPVCFWGDTTGQIYKASYFERFDMVDVWAQHDWLSRNPVTKGFVMTGRSDGVLNPSGIRFGSGEIYAIAEGPLFNCEIAETLCVGRQRPQDVDEAVFLFVRMSPGCMFSDDLIRRLREAIRSGLSPRHLPKFILQVDDIPVTINGKKVEVAVKKIISGKDIKVSSTVLNPDVLKRYKRFATFEEQHMSKL